MLLTYVKIGEPTEEDKKRTADALTVTNVGKGLHQGGQVRHIRLPPDGQAHGEERLPAEDNAKFVLVRHFSASRFVLQLCLSLCGVCGFGESVVHHLHQPRAHTGFAGYARVVHKHREGSVIVRLPLWSSTR